MKFLSWYSAIMISLGVLLCFYDLVTGVDPFVSFIAVALYTPVVVYLWKIIAMTNKKEE